MKNILIKHLCIIVGVLIIASCGNNEETLLENSIFKIDDDMLQRFQFYEVVTDDVEYEILLNAKINFNRENVVSYIPVISGQVTQVNFSLGDYVRKGQILALLRSGDIASATSDYIEAQTNLEIAEKKLETMQNLFKSGIASGHELMIAEREVRQTSFKLKQAKEYYELYGGENSEHGIMQQIKAPTSGYIVQRNINTGMLLQAGDVPIFTISDLKEVWIEASVFESDLSKIQKGQKTQIKVVSYPDTVFTGKIDHISNVIDPEDQTLKIRIKMNNDDGLLKPGMFARVVVGYVAQKRLPFIPTKSIIFDRNRHFIICVDENNSPEVKEIIIYAQLGDNTFVLEGIKDGERIISENQLLIYNHLNY